MIVIALTINDGEVLRQKQVDRVIRKTDINYQNTLLASNIVKNITKNEEKAIVAIQMEGSPKAEEPVVIPERIEVYDGLTFEELAEKLNRNLGSTLAGTGDLIASHSIELGVDPYIAVAIILHETGCNWNCSRLVKECYNVGGQKGGPSCGGGSYKSYPSLEAGIHGFVDNLHRNYFSKGLTTPETIGRRYAANPAWSTKINSYVNSIRAS